MIWFKCKYKTHKITGICNVSSTIYESLYIILQANEAAKLRVDVVNFSYGEACHWVDKGSVRLCVWPFVLLW